MIVIGVFVILFLIIANISIVHALGGWLVVMIMHGPLVDHFKEDAVHVPLYIGIIILAVIFTRNKWRSVPPGIMAMVISLIMLMCMSAMLGLDPEASISSILLYAKGFLMVIIIAMTIREESEIRTITLYCLLGLFLGALLAFYQYKTGSFRVNTETIKRVASLRGDPNDAAMLFLAGIPLAFYWFRSSTTSLRKSSFALCIALLLESIILTGSRGGFLGMLFVLFLIYWKIRSLKTTVLAVVIVVAAVLVLPGGYTERMNTIFTGKELKKDQSTSIDMRKDLQKKGFEIMMNNLLVGVGPGNFGRAFFSQVSDSNIKREMNWANKENVELAAHNMYLEFFSENGVFGGILLLFVLVKALLSLRKFDAGSNKREFALGYAISVSLLGMYFAGMFLSQAKNSVLWFLVGIGLTSSVIVKKRMIDAAGDRTHLVQENTL